MPKMYTYSLCKAEKTDEDILIKIMYKIKEALEGIDTNPFREEALNEVQDPEFLVISVDSFKMNGIKLMKKMYPDAASHFDGAIKFFNKRKKNNK